MKKCFRFWEYLVLKFWQKTRKRMLFKSIFTSKWPQGASKSTWDLDFKQFPSLLRMPSLTLPKSHQNPTQLAWGDQLKPTALRGAEQNARLTQLRGNTAPYARPSIGTKLGFWPTLQHDTAVHQQTAGTRLTPAITSCWREFLLFLTFP
jgi:hypothetical protein